MKGTSRFESYIYWNVILSYGKKKAVKILLVDYERHWKKPSKTILIERKGDDICYLKNVKSQYEQDRNDICIVKIFLRDCERNMLS